MLPFTFLVIFTIFYFFDRLRTCWLQQVPPEHVEIRQSEEHEDKVRVLRQPFVPNFGENEYLLRYQKDMLGMASRFRKQTVRFLVFLGELFFSLLVCALYHTRIMNIGGRGDEAADRLVFPIHS